MYRDFGRSRGWMRITCNWNDETQMSFSQWVNSVPPYVRKLHFMYEVIRTSGKYRWNIYRTSSKCRWSIYRTSRKRRGTLRIVHKVEQSSPTVILMKFSFSLHQKLSNMDITVPADVLQPNGAMASAGMVLTAKLGRNCSGEIQCIATSWVLTHWDRDKIYARRHLHFVEWKCMNFAWNFTEVRF